MLFIVTSHNSYGQILPQRTNRVKQRHSVRAVFEIDYGKIEIVHAADDFQGLAGIACEMAYTADLRQCVGNQFFQVIVFSEQENNWCLHAPNLVDKRIRALQ
jgi:hypothetical protein